MNAKEFLEWFRDNPKCSDEELRANFDSLSATEAARVTAGFWRVELDRSIDAFEKSPVGRAIFRGES